MEPSYDEIIIVAITFKNKLNWYIADKFLWIMNLEMLSKEDLDNYFEDEELKSKRYDIRILSEENIEKFLTKIKEYKLDENVLRLKILNRLEKQDDEIDEYYPVLMMDFDNKILYSQYPEPFSFENYIPNGWEGKYDSFFENIKEENKYWIYKGKNLLETKI